MKQEPKKYIARNKKATFDYFVLETYEAGIALFGTEIKSIRQGRVNLKDSYCEFDNGELFVHGMHISPYEQGNIFNKDPLRLKKLLMHKKEIRVIYGFNTLYHGCICTIIHFLTNRATFTFQFILFRTTRAVKICHRSIILKMTYIRTTTIRAKKILIYPTFRNNSNSLWTTIIFFSYRQIHL